MKKAPKVRKFVGIPHIHIRLFLLGGIVGGALVAAFVLYFKKPTLGPDLPQLYDPSIVQKLSITPSAPAYAAAPTPAPEIEVKIPIVMYHYIEYVKDPGDTIRKSLNVTPYTFDIEVKTLKEQNYDLLFAKELPDILDGKKKYSSRSAVLTFDDGYEDFYDFAYPILKKYNAKGTIYIIRDFIGRRGFLNESEIKEMLASGLIELGSHTLDHLYLKNIATSTAIKQIVESKQDLEGMFGVPVETFAYPYGAFTQETADIVKEASYTAALSTVPGTRYRQDALYYLPRIRGGAFYGSDIVKVLESASK